MKVLPQLHHVFGTLRAHADRAILGRNELCFSRFLLGMVCGAPIGHEIPSWLATMAMSTIYVVLHDFEEMPEDTIQSEFV